MYRRILSSHLIKRLPVLLLVIAAVLMGAMEVRGEESSSVILARAKRLQDSGVLMEAVAQYEAYIKMVPNNLDVRLTLIALLMQMKRNDQALVHINYATKHWPNDPRVKPYLQLSEAHYAQQTRTHGQQLENLVRQSKAKPSNYLEFARYQIANHNVSGGIEYYQKYLQMEPNDRKARFELIQHLAWQKRYAECQRNLNILLNQAPNDYDAHMIYGDIMSWQGMDETALDQYRQALKGRPGDRQALAKVKRIENTPGYREKKLRQAVIKDPHGVALTQLAQYYLEVGREWEADSMAKLRLSFEPGDSLAKKTADDIIKRRKDRREAEVQAAVTRLELNASDTSAMLLLARINSASADFPAAIEYYNRYKELYPLDYRIRLERAQVLLWNGDYKEAAQEFRVISVALPDNYQARIGLGESLIQLNEDMDEAEGIFAQDAKDHPNDIGSRVRYAYALRRLGKYDHARQIYRQLLTIDSTNQEAREGLRLMDQDFGPLIRDMELKAAANPLDRDLQVRLAGMYFDARRYYEAEKVVTRLLVDAPKDKHLNNFLAQIKDRRAAYEREQLAAARKKVLEHPDSTDLRVHYAELLAAAGNGKDALAQYRLILEQQPDQPDLTQKVADLLCDNQQYKEAIELYSDLADKFPTNYYYRYRLGLVLSWTGENEKAITELEGALRLNPQSVDAQLAMANAYKWKGDSYAAHDMYKRILAMYPNHVEAQQAVTEMDGAFFKGFEFIGSDGMDNETFHYSEAGTNAIASFSL